MKQFTTRRLPLAASIAAILASVPLAQAQEDAVLEMEEVVVTGSLRSLPGEDVEVFGFGKSLLETPRSASTISFEQMDRFNITDIDELVAFAPGTFTQSFFGVAGSLDVRGTPGETYFRGVRRLDNPGNYPTPIGASDRIDIVRGPASPIYGPAKIGGYLNFNPKSARAGSGDYLTDTEGAVSVETGSWSRQVVTAEVGGPISENMGYYLYGEFEDSDSFYDNTATEQTILQASFDVDLSDKLVMQFGGMYHDYEGNQVAGWNRLTQDLIDNGTYITGTAQPLDADGDGLISHQEYCGDPAGTADSCNNFAINPFFFDPSFVTGDQLDPIIALENVGTTTLDESNVVVAPDDTLENEVFTAYLDFVYTADSGLEIKNQLFYESYENLNENAYGFSQYHDSFVIEDKLIFAYQLQTGSLTSSLQFSPSIRYTDFEHGDDYINEYFDRRDLSIPSSERDASLDARLLATRIDDDYTEFYQGDYLDLGLALLGDFTWDNGFAVTLGLRQDWIEGDASSDPSKLLYDSGFVGVLEADDSESLTSWSVSASWTTDFGLVPYITLSEQGTVIAGQGAELQTGNVANGNWTDTSTLQEIGIKGSFLDDSLYFALSFYEQERTDFSAQAIVTNSADLTEGTEAELRWVVNENFILTAGWTNVTVENLDAQDNGNRRFSFLGADDMINLTDPSLAFGGAVVGLPQSPQASRKAGIPENVYTLTATYAFDNGLAFSGSIIDVDAVDSGFSQAVQLPAYTLVNAGISFETDHWTFQVNGKNLTDERYFRANFPNLFGSQIVLPELPRNFQARVAYKF
ncbi:TonB-dependent siderophore receptor [Congregibacter sp.]|uniref:TonB-dependent siderophore receptor n=1 Tax=Congregibacter sp. TaxID=2744308 RepID=UPI003F6BE391